MPYYQEGYSQEAPCTHWIDGKTGYNWSSYSLCNGTYSTMNKYCTRSADGYVDNKTELERTHDAARANWGGAWRMPTDAEWTWLRENCTWAWQTDYNGTGVTGYLVTSPVTGYTSNSIFLPVTGIKEEDGFVDDDHDGGWYWSSTLYETDSSLARSVYFDLGKFERSWDFRYSGLAVRPVTE